MSIATTFFTHVAHLFDGTGRRVVSFLDSLADAICKNGGQALIDAATKAVAAVEAPGVSGTEKRDGAFAIVKAELEGAGVTAVAHAINAALEAAVANLNAAKA